ncbi:MAG: Na+ dependent nucleoside transporter, partial [Saprospiraceae bacterium]|nr:Na+ dependent nucleoside transporter [Saprospiraceae bacterium]
MGNLLNYGRGILAIGILLGICYLFSANRKKVNWKLVAYGMALQLIIGLAILKVPFVNTAFDWIAKKFTSILAFSGAGAEFLFGDLVTNLEGFGYIFAFQVLPTIVFFSALSAVLYHFGILQWVVKGLAWVMTKTMGLSGPESLAAAANVFIGQTEAPLIVKPYLENMTRSEM